MEMDGDGWRREWDEGKMKFNRREPERRDEEESRAT